MTYDPKGFPAAVQEYALADFGPNLSNMAAKFQSQARGAQVAVQLDRRPGEVSSQELDAQPPALAARRRRHRELDLSVPGEWPVKVDVPAVDSKEVKDGRRRAGQALCLQERQLQEGRRQDRSPCRSARSTSWSTRSSTTDEKLLYLGERTISRLGCFGCHTIPGFENAKPIGTALNDWGIKLPARLDFGHITEYLTDQEQPPTRRATRDGTDLFYQEKVMHETPDGLPLSEAAPARAATTI